MRRVLDFCREDSTRGVYNFRLLDLTKDEPTPPRPSKNARSSGSVTRPAEAVSSQPTTAPVITAATQATTDHALNQVAPEDDPYLFNSVSMENMAEEPSLSSSGGQRMTMNATAAAQPETVHTNQWLTLVSQCTEKSLLDHDTIQLFVILKWRILPRTIYYLDLLLRLCFLVLYTRSSYVVNEKIYTSEFSAYTWILLILLIGFMLRELAVFIYTSVQANFPVYFRSWSTTIQLLNYAFCCVAIFVPNSQINTKTVFFSITLLVTYILFALRLDKMPCVGPYVPVLKKVLRRTMSFMPLFVIVFLGFLFSFDTRASYYTSNVSNGTTLNQVSLYASSFPINAVRLFYMMLGDFDQTQLGLGGDVSSQNFVNYILLLLFAYFMTLFLFNFFIAITVFELGKMLEDSNLILMRAKARYVLKIEAFLVGIKAVRFIAVNDYDPDKYHWRLIRYGRFVVRLLVRLFLPDGGESIANFGTIGRPAMSATSLATTPRSVFRQTSLKNEIYLIKSSLQTNENVNEVMDHFKLKKTYREKMKQ
jgi:hypothetical protein